MSALQERLAEALWQVYHRPARPVPWASGGNLPWNDPDFSRRMLREHLDESHSAASRVAAERVEQIQWLWDKLALQPGARLLDVTCGPGLYAVEFAKAGCQVTGVDFGPAAIHHARQLAGRAGVAGRCRFVEQDVRQMDCAGAPFDAATLIYGQLAVFTRAEAQALLGQIAAALLPGGRLCVELLDRDGVDKRESTWWHSGRGGLWGDNPYLHLGERFWYAEQELSLERFLTVDLETGALAEVQLCDQTYSVDEMTDMLRSAGFGAVDVFPSWDGLPLHDAEKWNAYLARRS